MSRDEQPISKVQWIERERLHSNDYNPNIVAPPELDLLELSIIEDGWTQPIVVRTTDIEGEYEIVDGFHRWTVSERPKVAILTDGYVPCVLTKNVEESQRRLSTIRHNRARGQHFVLKMADIVADLVAMGLSEDEIKERLGMEVEEVTRLLDRGNMLKRASNPDGLSEAWHPTELVKEKS